MENFKATKEDIAFAKNIWDNVIKTQTLNPLVIKAAHKRLFGFEAVNARQAQRKIYAYFTYSYIAETITAAVEEDEPTTLNGVGSDETETALPETSDTISVDNQNQSHQEDDTLNGQPLENDVSQNGTHEDTEEVIEPTKDDLVSKISALEAQYDDAKTNLKRSITMKIKALKKKL